MGVLTMRSTNTAPESLSISYLIGAPPPAPPVISITTLMSELCGAGFAGFTEDVHKVACNDQNRAQDDPDREFFVIDEEADGSDCGQTDEFHWGDD